MQALVTGGTSGIGYGVARHLTAAGWDVTIVGRNAQRGAQIATELKVQFISADLSLMAEVARLADSITAPLDALVLCAGVVMFQPEAQRTAEGLEVTFATNYLGRFALSQALLPKLANRGCIVMISGDGRYNKGVDPDWAAPLGGMAAAQRAALAGDMYAAALAQRQPQIRVHTCYPGLVKTSLLRSAPWPMRFFVGAFGSSIKHGSSYVTRLITEERAAVHWNKNKPLQFSPPLPIDHERLWEHSQAALSRPIPAQP